jgi:hypothetical protein
MIGTYTTNGMISPKTLRLIACNNENSQKSNKDFITIGSDPNAIKKSIKTIKTVKSVLETNPYRQTCNRITSGNIIPIQIIETVDHRHASSSLQQQYNAKFVIVTRQRNTANAENANKIHFHLVKCRSRIISVTDDGL